MSYYAYLSVLQFTDPPYKGFSSQFSSSPDFSKDDLPHDKFKCLECSISLIKMHQHSSQGDISASNEDLDFGGGGGKLFKAGSSNSLSPETRSRSFTTDSLASGDDSTPNTPQSGLVQDALKSSGSMTSGESPVNGERKSAAANGNRSPLVRLHHVSSEGLDLGKTGSGSSSGSKLNEALSPDSKSEGGSSSSSRHEDSTHGGSEGCGGSGDSKKEERESKAHGSPSRGVLEEDKDGKVKGHQDVLINVIQPRYVLLYIYTIVA